jgi:hypothetical protein
MRKLLLAALILLVTGCSATNPLAELTDGPCTTDQKNLVIEHIAGQVDAIAAKDWTLAYSFAAPTFQSAVDIDLFTLLISEQYKLLINNEGYSFGNCKILNSLLVQQITVSGTRDNIRMSYRLSVEDEKLGVVSAEITGVSEDIST